MDRMRFVTLSQFPSDGVEAQPDNSTCQAYNYACATLPNAHGIGLEKPRVPLPVAISFSPLRTPRAVY